MSAKVSPWTFPLLAYSPPHDVPLQMSRLEQKLEACLARGDFYEAHQIYRTLFYRLSSQEKYDELVDLLHAGAMRLIQGRSLGVIRDSK
jgi:hypothetical protein